MSVTMTYMCAMLFASLALLSCEAEKPHHVSRRVQDLRQVDIDSFKGKAIGVILGSVSDSVEGVYISHEPPGYLHSVSYYFADGYCLDFLIGKPEHQSAYNENQLWDTLRLQIETAREVSLRHHRDILYGRRFN